MGGAPDRVLDFDEAVALVLEKAAGLPARRVEVLPLLECVGRVLAEDVAADRDQPPFDRSTRDGFAIRAEAAGEALTVVGQVRAGEVWTGDALTGKQAIGIMTGAPLPAGADAVMMVEHVERRGDELRVASGRTVRGRENIVSRGSEARLGDVVLAKGTVVGAAEVAVAAACGMGTLKVYVRPTVGIVATGDELVEVEERPAEHQIRNSNSYSLAALVAEAGGEAVRMPIARDERGELEERIGRARDCDLIVLSGGVSMGEYDLVEEVLQLLGAEFFFTGVRMKPGKPVVFGRLPERGGRAARFFFGLPGNPVSTQVTFHCFVEPLLRAMRGALGSGPRFVQATLMEDVAGKTGLVRLMPARLMSERVRPSLKLVGWQGSGDLGANARANCYAVLPPGKSFASGDVITILLR